MTKENIKFYIFIGSVLLSSFTYAESRLRGEVSMEAEERKAAIADVKHDIESMHADIRLLLKMAIDKNNNND